MNKKYIWYASYGSNLLKERFMHYIKGGVCRFNGSYYDGCTDKSEPIDIRPCLIKHDLYFGNESSKWGYGGVAFLDSNRNEKAATLGRMYLITEEQFEEIHEQEGPGWYDKVLNLGMEDGFPIKTFTHSTLFPKNKPSSEYVDVIKKGLNETYPAMSDGEITAYMELCY